MSDREQPGRDESRRRGRRTPHPRRLFGVLDGLILLVPVAIGCAVARPYLQDSYLIPPQEWSGRWREIIEYSEKVASRFIAVMMPGLLVIRLRRPRPGLRRLSRQPGAVACAAASAAMVAGGLLAGTMAIIEDSASGPGVFSNAVIFWPRLLKTTGPANPFAPPRPPPPRVTSLFNQPESTWMIFQSGIAPAVMAAWAALILGRRWRAEPTWIDRAGRCCGCYWIMLSLSRWVMIVVGG
jgi:hypothetical protein